MFPVDGVFGTKLEVWITEEAVSSDASGYIFLLFHFVVFIFFFFFLELELRHGVLSVKMLRHSNV